MQCKYCGKECKNVILHEIRCKNNPNKLPPVSQLRKVTSNQYIKAKELGLPKPQLTQEAKEKCANSFKSKHHTEETKQKISNSYKKYLIEHPEKVPFKLNHSSKKSYPEQYFEELFINEGIPLKYHKQIQNNNEENMQNIILKLVLFLIKNYLLKNEQNYLLQILICQYIL